MKKTIVDKCKKIKLVATDIDGVWTDGNFYYRSHFPSQYKSSLGVGLASQYALPYFYKLLVGCTELSLK